MDVQKNLEWTVSISGRVKKQKDKLPPDILLLFTALHKELTFKGPAQPSWPHYGKLKGKKDELHHCHLNKNKPVYVVVWKVLDKKIRIMEVSYVGTHENAPY
ncbi:cytotoxic translational repressor of toxin-antitoxin stability system [Desulfovibrio sp. OttesenSCG-928-M16]|nr:cytotoxic translational repressor of toxin-antitoxin stability system [Desulfovibrio sp. OttesenSCG-928-M16]